MAYSELVKNFNRIRDYMRQFYVYGYKSRDEYDKKSGRSYDDERRRLDSFLGEYMKFKQTSDGRNVFISIDSRVSAHNPLYKAWKAKSFTDGDITLHFLLLDILAVCGTPLSLTRIMRELDEYLSCFDTPKTFDESTVRKKLKEYADEGIVLTQKHGKTMYFSLAESDFKLDADTLDYFSEVSPCGVVGSFLLDRLGERDGHFAFKHHYITNTMDSEIVCSIFGAMGEKRSITIETTVNRKEHTVKIHVIPMRIMLSAQNGRQYLMAYSTHTKRITSFRTDSIISVSPGEVCESFDELRSKLDGMMPHIWGVSTSGFSGKRMEHVEFTVRYDDKDRHIPRRLEREKRCGTVTHLDKNHSKFEADVYDAFELVPWIRTFICRITDIRFSDKELESRFKADIEQMYEIYGLRGGEGNDFQ